MTTDIDARLAALEKEWSEGNPVAPHEAMELCVSSGKARHEWPDWIEPAVLSVSRKMQGARVAHVEKRGRGRPPGVGFKARLAAAIACDLQNVQDLSARQASVTAWQTLHEHNPGNFPEAVPPESVEDVMRHIKAGRRRPIVYSPWLLQQALKRLPG